MADAGTRTPPLSAAEPSSRRGSSARAAARAPEKRNGASRPRQHALVQPGSAARLLVHALDVLPVHEVVEERLEVVRPAVAVVDVIGVFPHVAAQHRFGAMDEGVLAV